MKNTLIVYAAGCSWWDSIDKAGHTPKHDEISLPCCPHCGSVLFQIPSEEDWWRGVDKYQADGHPGYRDFVEWSRGRCFQNSGLARKAYDERDLSAEKV